MNDQLSDDNEVRPVMILAGLVLAGTADSPMKRSRDFFLAMDVQNKAPIQADTILGGIEQYPKSAIAGAGIARMFEELANVINSFCPASYKSLMTFMTGLGELVEDATEAHDKTGEDLGDIIGQETPKCQDRPVDAWVEPLLDVLRGQEVIYKKITDEIIEKKRNEKNGIDVDQIVVPPSKEAEETPPKEEEPISEAVQQWIDILEARLNGQGDQPQERPE